MATYYVELNGGDIAPKTELVGGVITPSVSFSGAQIYPTSGGGGTVTLQTKSVTYTPSTSQQTEQVTPDQGYDGLDKVNVTVDAVASGSVAVNNKQVTFTSPFSFNAATGKITSSSLYQNPITATVTPGYVDSAADGELTVYLNKTQQLDTVGATTYYPSTSDQTIATQQYLTGEQTIKGVTYSGLDAGNIKKDVVVKIGDSADDDRIVSVTGTYEGSGGGGWTNDGIASNTEPNGEIVLSSSVTTLKNYAFYGAPITSIIAPGVTTIGGDAINATQITSITDTNFPALGASSRTDVIMRLPSTCTSIKLSNSYLTLYNGSGAFRYCAGLRTAEFPHAAENVASNNKTMGNFCFGGCSNLEMADIGSVTSISSNGFNGDTKLRTLVLRSPSVVALPAWNGNNLSGIYNNPTLSTIYVPETLISTYETASNWSAGYAAGLTFAKIEGSIYEL